MCLLASAEVRMAEVVKEVEALEEASLAVVGKEAVAWEEEAKGVVETDVALPAAPQVVVAAPTVLHVASREEQLVQGQVAVGC